mmetsp:Transcript_8534/g.12630  ORF Transcript_8534/g.12630 Transcript_8534/m.12630 type:complete len:450 (+) Transcript_8534:43-1392(+)
MHEVNESSLLIPEKQTSKEQFLESLKLLKESPRELFFLYILNFIFSFQYYIEVTLAPLYFTDIQGLSDFQAGLVFCAIGVGIGVSALCFGPFLHSIGLKTCLFISSSTSICGFLLLFFIESLWVSLVAVLGFLSVSGALSWPVVELGSKMYTDQSIRNVSHSMIWISNYGAGAVAGLFIDFFWADDSQEKTTFGALFLACAVLGTVALLLGLLFRLSQVKEENFPDAQAMVFITRSVMSEKRFWRFCTLILILTFLRSGCFGHLDATFPKYMVRELGDDAHFGLMLTLHSVTMLLGVFFFTQLTFAYSSYSLICAGGLIGTAAPIFLVFSSNYLLIVMFVVLISVGESIWVPRLLDYTLEVAPLAEEGIYLAISNCPFYFGMVITGVISGELLKEYCPEEGEKECQNVWVVVVLTTVFIPFVLVAFRKFLEQPPLEENPYMPCSKENIS